VSTLDVYVRFGHGVFQVRVMNTEDRGVCDRDPLYGQYGQKEKLK